MNGSALLVGVVLATVMGAAPALSQSQRATPPAPSVQPSFPGRGLPRVADPGAPNDPQRAAALQSRVFAEMETRIAQGVVPKARLERAARVGALIDQGLCGPAAQLARAEHDDAMADRVPDACAAHRTARHS